MLNQVKWNVKSMVRNKDYIIWILIFPLAYFTIFYFAFSGTTTAELAKFPPIEVGLVTDKEEDQAFKDILGDIDLIDLKATSPDQADLEDQLLDGEIQAVIYPAENENGGGQKNPFNRFSPPIPLNKKWDFLMASNNAYRATVVREVVQGVNSVSSVQESIQEGIMEGKLDWDKLPFIQEITQKPGRVQPEENHEMDFKPSSYNKLTVKADKPGISPLNGIFYASLAYIAFMPLNVGLMISRGLEANQTTLALRKLAGPKSKFSLFLASFLPFLFLQLLVTTFGYFYAKFLGAEYSSYQLNNLILLWLGASLAILFGSCIGVLTGKKPEVGSALCIALPLFFAFSSGMMSQPAAQILENVPVLAQIQATNPVRLMTQGLYVLAMEGPTSRYRSLVRHLVLQLVVALVLVMVLLRRKNYENI